MDAFEQVVAEILWLQGHWVRTSFKVELSKEEKRKIGRPSCPRWELDIVAYSGRSNVLSVVECKSYLDSSGVQAKGFDATAPEAHRYKLFNDLILRETVFSRLKRQLFETGFCPENPEIKLCLVCGKTDEKGRASIQAHFQRNGWELWDETWLRHHLQLLATRSYENHASAVVSKLLLRGELSRDAKQPD